MSLSPRPTRRARSNSRSGSFGSDDGFRQSSRLTGNERNPKQSISPTSNGMIGGGSSLKAILSQGRIVEVSIQVNGSLFIPSKRERTVNGSSAIYNGDVNHDPFTSGKQTGDTYVPNPMGEDGNLFYCDSCRGVGDVVCCDGCPRVYHPTCIPINSESRKSLDADEDPWYCPTCMKEGKSALDGAVTNATNNTQRASRSKKMCVECHKSSGGKMGKCQICSATMHVPNCRDYASVNVGYKATCSNCVAEFVVEDEEQERIEEGAALKNKKKKLNSKSIQEDAHDYSSSESSSDITPPPPPLSFGRKNAKSSSTNNEDQRKVNGKSKTRRLSDDNDTSDDRPLKKMRTEQEIEDSPSFMLSMTPQHLAPVKRNIPEETTSPFFFFLMENRIRLERQITRKNRSFKKLTGYDRNLMLSKEGVLVWTKMSRAERQKYLDMSIQEFEYNVLSWKEDETIREMMLAEASHLEQDDPSLHSEDQIGDVDIVINDNSYWDKKVSALIAPTQVGGRKVRSSPEPIQNGVLLELLQDSRFHSLPMMKANRENELEMPDYSMTAVPHFNVEGPISTSVGDTCLGCVRGWNHFCPIVKTQLPAVEHRAKLQPPCPTLLPVRVGVGLPQSVEDEKHYSYSDKKTYKELRFLSHPSTRGDEIVQLIETAMAAKIPISKHTKEETMSAPQHKMKAPKSTKDNVLYECGRCKAITTSNMGCVTCRRVKLLVDMSKKRPGEKDNTTVKTVMLGRAFPKIDDFNCQTDGEKRIAQGLIRKLWKPNAILPPMKKTIPPKYPPYESSSDDDDSSSTDSSSSDDSSSEEENEMSETDETPIEEILENEESKSPDNEAAPKRKRVTRSVVSKSNEETSKINSDLQEMAEVHKGEADYINARCLFIATCGILLAMIRRDPLRLFADPVPASVEGYHKIIKKPMDFSTMREKVLNGQYTTLGNFMTDARLLCINSLVYNPPGTIYSITAEEIQSVLNMMQKRAGKWMYAIKNAHASHYTRNKTQANIGHKRSLSGNDYDNELDKSTGSDPFLELRQKWPAAVELLEDNGEWLQSQIESEFVRTRENEYAYYSALAVRRAACAAEASLSPIFDSDLVFTPCIRRSHTDDELLREYINKVVAQSSDPGQITTPPSWREQDVLEFLKKVQKRRVETKISPEDGCARCDKISIDDEANKLAKETSVIRKRKRNDGVQVRVADSRRDLSNGMASKRERDRVLSSQNEALKTLEAKSATARDRSVTVRGSSIQGWGLFADHPFKRGELVAEYVGEYVVNPMADKREKFYEERRIQDYQFRVSANLVIDATKLGGHARYINHSCDPSCVAKIIDGDPPNQHLKRVVVISQRDIQCGEEITYDYQFPLELDLDARIPCNCGSKSCRGFMNWDLPESGSMVARASTRQGRRDRIRRLVNKAL